LYEYECSKCGTRFEKIEKVNAPHRQKCPKCGARAERLLAAPAIQFKGSGWYVTDYAGRGAAKETHEAKDAGDKKETKETKPPAKEKKAAKDK
jgi:putative FmdB family regulatory protein